MRSSSSWFVGPLFIAPTSDDGRILSVSRRTVRLIAVNGVFELASKIRGNVMAYLLEPMLKHSPRMVSSLELVLESTAASARNFSARCACCRASAWNSSSSIFGRVPLDRWTQCGPNGPRSSSAPPSSSLNLLVGAPRFELGTPSPPDWCANRAALRSERRRTIVTGGGRRNRLRANRLREARTIVSGRPGAERGQAPPFPPGPCGARRRR
jgi:hypothetical protein